MQRASLIDELARDVGAARKVPFARSLGLWVLASFAIWAIFLAIVGVRWDLSQRVQEPLFIISLLLLAGSFAATSFWCLEEAVPGRVDRGDASFAPRLRKRRAVTIGIAYLAAVLTYSQVAPSTTVQTPLVDSIYCCLRITLGATVPCCCLSVLASRLFPLNARMVSALSVTSGVMLVCLVGQLNCADQGTAHILVGHGFLLWGFNAATYKLATKFLDASRKDLIGKTMSRVAAISAKPS